MQVIDIKRYLGRLGSGIILVFAIVSLNCPPVYALSSTEAVKALLEKSCPSSPYEWKLYMEQLASVPFGIQSKPNDLGDVIARMDQCRSSFMNGEALATSAKESVNRCLDHVERHLETILALEEQPNNPALTEIPAELLVPSFLHDVYDPAKIESVRAYIDELNKSRAPEQQIWFAPFQATFDGVVANTGKSRLMIYVPGSPALYLAYVVATPELLAADPEVRAKASMLPENISVLAVEPLPDGTSRTHFIDNPLQKKPTESGEFKYTPGHKSTARNTSCNGCHMGKPIAITEFNPAFAKEAAFINQTMYGREYSISGGQLSDLGPPVGPVKVRSDEQLYHCIDSIPDAKEKYDPIKNPDGRLRVRNMLSEHMQCAKCHDGTGPKNQRFISAYEFSKSVPMSQILLGNMPRNIKLPNQPPALENFPQEIKEHFISPEIGETLDRVILYFCLDNEIYARDDKPGYGQLGDWLLSVSCADKSFDPNGVVQSGDNKLGAGKVDRTLGGAGKLVPGATKSPVDGASSLEQKAGH